MTDIYAPGKRSAIMSKIRSKDTKPEMLVRKLLFNSGFRYRLHRSDLPGKPDLVLPKYRTVVFVNGCFWHGHEGCSRFKLPSEHNQFWKEKIRSNQARDREVERELLSRGWRILTIWQCACLKSRLDLLFALVNDFLTSDRTVGQIEKRDVVVSAPDSNSQQKT